MQRVLVAIPSAILLGILAGALYTISPLTAWCAALAAIVLALAGRALRTRDVITGAPVGPYDYFVASDEYGRNSYITLLTGIQVLFGPTPYSMRLLNTLLFLIAGILLFRLSRSAFASLPAFIGLAVFLFLPTLFYWSISLLKEPLYLLGTTLVISGAVASARAQAWSGRA